VSAALAAMVGAAVAFVVVLLRWPTTRWVVAIVAVDVALATGICVVQGMLLPPGLVAQGASWVAAVASVAIIVANLTLDTPVALLASLVVMGGWAVGSTFGARASGGLGRTTELGAGLAAGTAHLVSLVIQAGVTAVMMMVVVRAARAADTALRERERVDTAEAIEAARRLDERVLRRRLHDTVLATLTMVGSGAIVAGSRTLRNRAAGDLAVLAELGAVVPPPVGTVRLDERLGGLVDRFRPLVDVQADLIACEVPTEVAEAMAGAVHEALVNIAKHAEVETARLWLRRGAGGVVVEVADAGVGFDPTRVGRHHLGLRESIKGRLDEVGGTASVVSAEGFGCTVTLGWRGA
jgi:signal transduction histidine kinase